MTITQAISRLQLSSDITRVAIKKAYRLAAQSSHPDKKGSDSSFRQVKEAYDLLMRTPLDDIRAHMPPPPTRQFARRYDPFTDVDYERRQFFQPDNPHIEGFERSTRAHGCRECNGTGMITKNIDPKRGFLGLDTRLCKCQWL